MMRLPLCFFILLRAICLIAIGTPIATASAANSSELSSTNIVGDYQLEGMREAASALSLNADGKYKFRFMAGSVDEVDEGTWRIKTSKIRLNSTRSGIAPTFAFVRSNVDAVPGIKVSFVGPDARNVAKVADVRVVVNGITDFANKIGNGSRETFNAWPPVERVSLSFVGMLRSYDVFEHRPTDPTHNHFVFRSTLGNFGAVRFKELTLTVDSDALVVTPPGFNREFRYVRISPKMALEAPAQ